MWVKHASRPAVSSPEPPGNPVNRALNRAPPHLKRNGLMVVVVVGGVVGVVGEAGVVQIRAGIRGSNQGCG
jgi:hypothetical protein